MASSNAPRVLRGSLRVGQGRNIQHARVSPEPVGLALRADAPDLVHGLGLADHGLVDLVDLDRAVPAVRLQPEKHLGRSAPRIIEGVAVASSTRRPKKVR